MRLRYSLAAVGFNLMMATGAQAVTPDDLIGCWRIQSLVIDPAGSKSEPFGSQPAGQFIFTRDHVSYIVMRPDLPDEWQMKVVNGRIVNTLITYFGTYTVKDKELTIKAEAASRADWRNRTFKRIVLSVSKTELVLDNEANATPARITSKRC